ncbi:MAG: 1,6-anhydro-N-acetylmuramyl-L-alanine amidase AmpD [Gallionella sp.]|nr:1,6-anhydro-N-acetylmuramyl-L-alanine amidase AmpD [Gallionella sp.]MDD4960122.1 1,6-anhydro-N-acetylmuramyl-L-alanine amidase AmpD [Gallionella sp.]
MKIDTEGWLIEGERLPSPNCDHRPEGAIELLVIHNISLPPNEFGGTGVAELFTNTLDHHAHPYYQTLVGLKVSAHFFIRRDGTIIQFVSCLQRAWHAGVSSWQGRSRCNDFSIGIELEGSDFVPYTPAQYDALHELTRALRHCYPLTGIAGHQHIAPQRKTDPGEYFDWQGYLSRLR